VAAGLWVGAAVFVLSFWGWSAIEETYHKDLDYLEVGEA
jgi:predicted metal-dependent hydrolase